MHQKNLMPQAAQPVNRTTTGQLPAELAELSEEALFPQGAAFLNSSASVLPSYGEGYGNPSYDGDDAE